MENLYGNNMHVLVLSCFKFTSGHKNMHVFMYFFHLVPTYPPPLHHSGIGSVLICTILALPQTPFAVLYITNINILQRKV